MDIERYNKNRKYNWIVIIEKQIERGFDHYLLYATEKEIEDIIENEAKSFGGDLFKEYEHDFHSLRQEFGNTVQYKYYDTNGYGDIHIMAALTDLKAE